MSKRIHRVVMIVSLAFFAAIGLMGCSLFTITVDLDDIESIQRLDVGDLLVVRLLGNASTGYEWIRVEPDSFDGSPIEIIEEADYQTLGIEPVGAPGEYIFRYRALRPGTLAMEFEHRRPWEPEEPVDRYSITIWVR